MGRRRSESLLKCYKFDYIFDRETSGLPGKRPILADRHDTEKIGPWQSSKKSTS